MSHDQLEHRTAELREQAAEGAADGALPELGEAGEEASEVGAPHPLGQGELARRFLAEEVAHQTRCDDAQAARGEVPLDTVDEDPSEDEAVECDYWLERYPPN